MENDMTSIPKKSGNRKKLNLLKKLAGLAGGISLQHRAGTESNQFLKHHLYANGGEKSERGTSPTCYTSIISFSFFIIVIVQATVPNRTRF